MQTEKQPPAHGSVVESDAGKVHPLSVSVTVLFPPLGERATPKRESCMYECQASAVTRVKVEPKCFSVMIGLSVWFVCSDVTNKPE